MIKHIFADFDGTLMNSKGHLTKTIAGAVRTSQIPFTLITGRSPVAMQKYLKRLNLRTMQVAYNGAVIFKRTAANCNLVINEFVIDPLVGAALVHAVKTQYPWVSVNLYDLNHRYNELNDERSKFEQKVTGQIAKTMPMKKVFNQKEFKLFQISLVAFEGDELIRVKQFIERLHVPEISVRQYGPSRLVIMNKDARRDRSINYIMMAEHLYSDEIAGFGDDDSDLPMLKMVGLPIVTASANDRVKDVARYVIPGTDDNGVAAALRLVPELQF